MKNLLYPALCLMMACGSSGLKYENGVVFESKKLKGVYAMERVKLDGKPEDQMKNDWMALAFTSSASMELTFYGNGKGFVNFSTGWLGLFIENKGGAKEFEYSLVKDSVLMLNDKPMIIKKVSDNYDYIEMKNGDTRVLLKKIVK